MIPRRLWQGLLAPLLLAAGLVGAYEVPVSDTDYDRQICSGMWGGKNTFINVTFDASSQGQLAMVVYEWKDMPYLGKITNEDSTLPQRTYVCTSDAVRGGYCDNSQLGRFIIDLPEGKLINETSFWSARVGFLSGDQGSSPSDSEVSAGSFWDNPEGNPTPPDANSEYTSPWRREYARADDALNSSPTGILWYKESIQYLVRKTGYYCVAIVPVTVISSNQNAPRQASTDVPFHPSYQGSVLFQNKFKGRLPAAEYPKVNVRRSVVV
ncbi:hypothetical protein EIP86_004499 [Pleurotus ostreatoroseus]|nr:hypothetical protein EIP86_004499 [Pleurotus ostreatoroseus]